jgi:coenzyme F420-reducing hydrogenase delta subunit
VQAVSKLLDKIGLEGNRVRMVNISSAMGGRFAELATEMTEHIRGLGPNPLGSRSPLAKLGESPQGEPADQNGNQT